MRVGWPGRDGIEAFDAAEARRAKAVVAGGLSREGGYSAGTLASLISRTRCRACPSSMPYTTFFRSRSGAEKHVVHGSSERSCQVLDEGFEQHAGSIDGQNDNFLPPFCQAIPFQI